MKTEKKIDHKQSISLCCSTRQLRLPKLYDDHYMSWIETGWWAC